MAALTCAPSSHVLPAEIIALPGMMPPDDSPSFIISVTELMKSVLQTGFYRSQVHTCLRAEALESGEGNHRGEMCVEGTYTCKSGSDQSWVDSAVNCYTCTLEHCITAGLLTFKGPVFPPIFRSPFFIPDSTGAALHD